MSYLQTIELSTITCYSFVHSRIVYITLAIFKLLPLEISDRCSPFVPIDVKNKVSNSVQNNHSYNLPCKLLHWKSIPVNEIARQDVHLIYYASIIIKKIVVINGHPRKEHSYGNSAKNHLMSSCLKNTTEMYLKSTKALNTFDFLTWYIWYKTW